MPTTLAVEPGGSLISYGTCEPRCESTLPDQTRFGIGQQGRSDPSTTGSRGYIELIQLVALETAKTSRGLERTGNTRICKQCWQPVSEAPQRTISNEFRRNDCRVCILPFGKPQSGKARDIAGLRRPDVVKIRVQVRRLINVIAAVGLSTLCPLMTYRYTSRCLPSAMGLVT